LEDEGQLRTGLSDQEDTGVLNTKIESRNRCRPRAIGKLNFGPMGLKH
jgi:hypothetical protein